MSSTMENFFSNFFIINNNYPYYLLFILSLFASSYFLIFKKNNNKSPPTPFALPIIGHIHLINKPLPEALRDLSDRYGPVLLLRFGSQPVLALNSPSVVEECFTKHDITFADRPNLVAAKYLGYDSTTVEWASYGPHWRNLRRVMNQEIFSPSTLPASTSIRNEEVHNLIRQLCQRSSSSSSSSSSLTLEMNRSFKEVDMTSMFFELGFNVVWKMATGKRYSGDKIWTFESIVRGAFFPKIVVYMVDWIPILRLIDFEGKESNLKRMRRNKDDILDDLMAENRKRRMANISAKKQGSTAYSLIDALLSLQEEDPETYTEEIIKGIAAELFAAGIETTMKAMVAAMSLLLKNPGALAKLRTELDLHVEGRVITESDLPKLTYLQCVVKEALRLHPPAPVPLPHTSSQDCTIGGYDIPRGTMLFVNVWSIQRDPKVWEEPTKFKPERFEGLKEDKIEGFKWMPFGLGRRGCPGSGMAMRVVSLAVGAMIQCFEWKKVDDELNEVDMPEAAEFGEPSPRAMYRPRMDQKDLLSQI